MANRTIPGNNNTKHANTGSDKKLYIILALLSFVVYANTLSKNYAYDDFAVITKNTIVTKGLSAIPKIFLTPYRAGFFKTNNDLYRPLSLVMFAGEYQLFNGTPMVGHFINVVVFACCVVLLFIFLNALFENKRRTAAFIAALLFALHPIHTEVVANIKSRDELLCFFFALLSVITYMRYAASGKMIQLLSGGAFLLLSLLAKETSISFIAVIPFVFFFYRNEYKGRSLSISVLSVVTAGIFIAIRYLVLRAYDADHTFDIKFIDNFLVKVPVTASALATEVLIMSKYLELLFIPYPLVCDYSYNSIPFVGWGNVSVWLSLIVLMASLIYSVYRLLKFSKDAFAFGFLFFFATIALFSNMPFLIGAAMAERFVFFASAGFCFLVALFIEQLLKGRSLPFTFAEAKDSSLFSGIILCVSLIFAAVTIARNTEWVDSLTLYRADVAKSPDNARLQMFAGNELLITVAANEPDHQLKRQAAMESIGYLKKALAIYPEYAEAHKIMGNGYFFLSELDSAAHHYQLAAIMDTTDMEALNNLDVTYFNAQRFDKSVEVCWRIIKLNPSNTERYNNIGICYIRMAAYDSAVNALKKGIELNGGFPAFYENLALAYKMTNARDSALKYQGIAKKYNPLFSVY